MILINIIQFLPLNLLCNQKSTANCLLWIAWFTEIRRNNSFRFSIYRTKVCSYIHFHSGHHGKAKHSVFSLMFLRVLCTYNPEFSDEKFEHIYHIGLNLKCPRYFLASSLSLAKTTFYWTSLVLLYDTNKPLVLPFSNSFSQVPHILKTWDVKVAFDNPYSFKILLYARQTGKGLSTRLKQDKYSVRTAQESNALFVYMRDFNRCLDWANVSSVFFFFFSCNIIVNKKLVESSLIKHPKLGNMNISGGMYKLDEFITDNGLEWCSPNVIRLVAAALKNL